MATYLKNITLANESNITTEAGVSIISVSSNGTGTVNTSVSTITDLTTTGNTILGDSTSDTTTVNGALTATIWVQSTAVARTATTDGLTTGIIPAGATFIDVTSSGNTKIISLPTPVLGNIIYMQENAGNAFNVIPAARTQYINGTLVDGSKKLAIAGGAGTAVFTCTVGWANGKWTQYYIDDDGTIDAGGTPA